MTLRIRIALLLMLIGAAAFTGAEALRSLRRPPAEAFPEEIYARFARGAESASYILREDGDYISVFPAGRFRGEGRCTGIELQSLRRADRAMIREGLPVSTRPELLQLLEDLGS